MVTERLPFRETLVVSANAGPFRPLNIDIVVAVQKMPDHNIRKRQIIAHDERLVFKRHANAQKQRFELLNGALQHRLIVIFCRCSDARPKDGSGKCWAVSGLSPLCPAVRSATFGWIFVPE